MIAVVEMPLASDLSICSTLILMPRIVGLPPKIAGFSVIRSASFVFLVVIGSPRPRAKLQILHVFVRQTLLQLLKQPPPVKARQLLHRDRIVHFHFQDAAFER